MSRKLSAKYAKMMESQPKSVAIIGMGPSAGYFCSYMQKHNLSPTFPDEIWGINFTPGWLAADKCFLMDGIRRGDGSAEWIMWLKSHKKVQFPIIMPFAMEGHPNVVSYPIQEVVHRTGETWFGNSLAYAIAFAVAIGSVRRIDFWGCDFDYTERINELVVDGKKTGRDAEDVETDARTFVHSIETGHACGAYWAGLCRGFNIQTRTPVHSSFMSYSDRTYYGYGDKQPDIEATIHDQTVTLKTEKRDKPQGEGAVSMPE